MQCSYFVLAVPTFKDFTTQLLIGLKDLLIGAKSWKPHMALCRWLDEFEKLAIMSDAIFS